MRFVTFNDVDNEKNRAPGATTEFAKECAEKSLAGSAIAGIGQESKLEAQGKFLEVLLGDKAHLLTETIQ